MRLSIELNQRDLDRAAAELAQVRRGLPLALSRALNRTITGVRTDAVKAVRAEADVSAGRVRDNVKLFRATTERLSAAVIATGRDIPLIHFRTRPSKPQTKGGRRPAIGVTAQTFKSQGGQVYPGSFVARVPTGHLGVFERKGRARLPIKQLYGPSAADALDRGNALEGIERRARIRLRERFDHEVDRLLGV